MAAYLLVRCRIRDRDAFRRYAAAAAELTTRMGGRYLVRGGDVEVLEHGLGTAAPDVAHVISQWPTRAAALGFWHSAEYAALRPVRADCADAEVTLLGGIT
jgi:uncharacterized protein (DUF1330 family)